MEHPYKHAIRQAHENSRRGHMHADAIALHPNGAEADETFLQQALELVSDDVKYPDNVSRDLRRIAEDLLEECDEPPKSGMVAFCSDRRMDAHGRRWSL